MEQIKGMVVDRCDLPEGYDVNKYEFFQGKPTKALKDNEIIDIGDRFVQIVHTPLAIRRGICVFGKRSAVTFLQVIWFIKTRSLPTIRPPIQRHTLTLWSGCRHSR